MTLQEIKQFNKSITDKITSERDESYRKLSEAFFEIGQTTPADKIQKHLD